MPQRFIPMLISTSTPTVTPAFAASAEIWRRLLSLSQATHSLHLPASVTSAFTFSSPTISFAIRTSLIPPSTSAAACESFAQVTPTAPPLTSRCASKGVRIALVWGRQSAPSPLIFPDITRMLCSRLSKSTRSAGVGSSPTGRPTSSCVGSRDAHTCSAIQARREGRMSVGGSTQKELPAAGCSSRGGLLFVCQCQPVCFFVCLCQQPDSPIGIQK